MDDDFPDTVKKCLDMLDENTEILSNLEEALDDEQEDNLTPDMQLHNLYDMAEDVSEKSKIRHAESNFMKRQAEDNF